MKISLRFLISGLLFIYFHELSAQTSDINWAVKAGGQYSDVSTDVCIDNSGNKITTGYFGNTAIFGNTRLVSAGSADIFFDNISFPVDQAYISFLTKYNPLE